MALIIQRKMCLIFAFTGLCVPSQLEPREWTACVVFNASKGLGGRISVTMPGVLVSSCWRSQWAWVLDEQWQGSQLESGSVSNSLTRRLGLWYQFNRAECNNPI